MMVRWRPWLALLLVLPVFGAAVAQEPAKHVLPQLTFNLESLQYPPAELKQGLQGRVLVAFTVTKRGKADEPMVVVAEPAEKFDEAAIKAVKLVKFTVPRDWEDSGGTAQRFQLSVLFKLSPCVAPECVAPTPHEQADDFLIISAQRL